MIQVFILLLGALGLGAMHAFEPDHMAAVSTFVAKRPSPRQAAWFGINWAMGHGLSLLIFGSILYALRRVLEHDQPFLFSSGILDRFVGVVLIGLGLWTLLQLRVGEMHHSHHHSTNTKTESETHTHADGTTHSHATTHRHSHGNGLGSLLMGMLHGGAGTGAFLVQAINAQAASHYGMIVAFTFAFSVGVLASMGFYAALLGGAIAWGGRRMTRFFAAAHLVTGVLACGVGACMLIGLELPGLTDIISRGR